MFYRFGKVSGISVEWYGDAIRYDSGQYPQVAINDSGSVVEVHESHDLASTELFYRLGHIVGGPPYTVVWDSGSTGIDYQAGRHPHVTIDSDGNVIEVHQAVSNHDLHYLRARVNVGDDRIEWEPSPSNGRYVTGNATRPAIALSDNGFVLETHNGSSDVLKYINGDRNTSSNNVVDWSSVETVNDYGYDSSVSTNNSVVAMTYESGGVLNKMYLLTGEVSCP
jgi:hypothetical protein